MLKKFFNEYGFMVITTSVLTVTFLFGFVVGRYGKAAPSLEVIEREANKQKQTTVVSDVEAPAPEEEHTEAPAPKYTEISVIATAYCPCEKCCGKCDGITATGTKATAGRTIAVDPSIIPYGTEIIIDGHTYIAEDCGGAVKGNRVDIFFDTHEEAKQFGKRQLIAKVKY